VEEDMMTAVEQMEVGVVTLIVANTLEVWRKSARVLLSFYSFLKSSQLKFLFPILTFQEATAAVEEETEAVMDKAVDIKIAVVAAEAIVAAAVAEEATVVVAAVDMVAAEAEVMMTVPAEEVEGMTVAAVEEEAAAAAAAMTDIKQTPNLFLTMTLRGNMSRKGNHSHCYRALTCQ
jgi:hypothetical protein